MDKATKLLTIKGTMGFREGKPRPKHKKNGGEDKYYKGKNAREPRKGKEYMKGEENKCC